MAAKISVIPALQYEDAKAAIEFLCTAFGFAKNAVYEEPDGSVAHCPADPRQRHGHAGSTKDTEYGRLLRRPAEAGGVTMSVYVVVDDADGHFRNGPKPRARQIVREPVTQDYGGRDYTCKGTRRATSGPSGPMRPDGSRNRHPSAGGLPTGCIVGR
jgi:uncharacterized glyoxalase superfamily protein PhnB